MTQEAINPIAIPHPICLKTFATPDDVAILRSLVEELQSELQVTQERLVMLERRLESAGAFH